MKFWGDFIQEIKKNKSSCTKEIERQDITVQLELIKDSEINYSPRES